MDENLSEIFEGITQLNSNLPLSLQGFDPTTINNYNTDGDVQLLGLGAEILKLLESQIINLDSPDLDGKLLIGHPLS